MSGRERWQNIFHFKKVDRIFNCEFGWWTDTLKRWHREGLPEDVDTNEKGDTFFNFDYIGHIPVNLGLIPPFESKILEETEKYQIIQDSTGVICKIFKDGQSTIPHYIKFPVQTKRDWEEFKERLNPQSKRYPENWEELKKLWSK